MVKKRGKKGMLREQEGEGGKNIFRNGLPHSIYRFCPNPQPDLWVCPWSALRFVQTMVLLLDGTSKNVKRAWSETQVIWSFQCICIHLKCHKNFFYSHFKRYFKLLSNKRTVWIFIFTILVTLLIVNCIFFSANIFDDFFNRAKMFTNMKTVIVFVTVKHC